MQKRTGAVIRARVFQFLILASLAGCQAFRAEVGGGLGIGAEVAIPVVVHTGVAFSAFKYAGLDYGVGAHAGREDQRWEKSVNFFCVHQIFTDTDMTADGGLYETYWENHFCLGLAPLLGDTLRNLHPRNSYALEVDIYALVFAIRLGFCPYYLFEEKPGQPEPSPQEKAAQEHLSRGNELSEKGEHAAAAEEYSKGVESKPDAAMYCNRGIAYLRLNRIDDGQRDFTEAIRMAPRVWNAYFLRGNTYVVQKNYLQAIADFDKAIELNPDQCDAYSARGMAYYLSGAPQHDLALADFSTVIAKQPDNGRGYLQRAGLYLAQRKRALAQADLDKAAQLGTEIPEDLAKLIADIPLEELPLIEDAPPAKPPAETTK